MLEPQTQQIILTLRDRYGYAVYLHMGRHTQKDFDQKAFDHKSDGAELYMTPPPLHILAIHPDHFDSALGGNGRFQRQNNGQNDASSGQNDPLLQAAFASRTDTFERQRNKNQFPTSDRSSDEPMYVHPMVHIYPGGMLLEAGGGRMVKIAPNIKNDDMYAIFKRFLVACVHNVERWGMNRYMMFRRITFRVPLPERSNLASPVLFQSGGLPQVAAFRALSASQNPGNCAGARLLVFR